MQNIDIQMLQSALSSKQNTLVIVEAPRGKVRQTGVRTFEIGRDIFEAQKPALKGAALTYQGERIFVK